MKNFLACCIAPKIDKEKEQVIKINPGTDDKKGKVLKQTPTSSALIDKNKTQLENPKSSKITNKRNANIISNTPIDKIGNENKSSEVINEEAFHRGNSYESNVAQKGESSPHMSAYHETSSSKLITNKIQKLNNPNNDKFNECPKIEGEILESPSIPNLLKRKFIINPKGLEGSLRNAHDFYSYFGTGMITEKSKDVDFPLPSQQGLGSKHFYIRFDKYLKSYFIKDMGSVGGTFKMVDEPLILKNSNVISIGQIQMIIFLYDLDNTITIKIVDDTENSKTYKFEPNNAPITIGRGDKNSIPLQISGLSREHSFINFENNHWYIKDGSIDNKPSTNGTWLYLSEETEITNNSKIKASETLFNFKFVY